MSNFKSMIAKARLPEDVVQICLRGDLAADHELAERELERAQKTASDSLAGNGAAAIAERIEGLEAQMREYTIPFRLRALSRPAWRSLIAAHPPRRDEGGKIVDDDAMLVNAETFFDAMIRACIVEPELDDDDWEQLNASITDRQYDTLSNAAWALNRRDVDVPFSLAASRMRRASDGE